MSMHQGLDLSRFKKVSSDKKMTTLRHAKGHEIKVAHSAMTPKMREQIENMPVHMADGGEVEDDAPEETEAPEADTEEAQPAASAEAPAQPQAQIPPPISSQQLKLEDAATQYDYANGHIKPETYKDLFAKKDTLGKIGTLFGLMLGGAGSGLTHQPNALLDMMNREITNDFEAQKSNAANKLNFLSLNQKQQLQSAEIKKMQQEGVLNEAQAKHLIAEANTKSYALARMQANRAALHHLVAQVNKYPVGSPQRIQAEQSLAMLSKAVQSENFDLADQAEVSSALGRQIFGTPDTGVASTGPTANPDTAFQQPPAVNPESTFQQGQNVLRVSGNESLAKERESHHIPGIEGQSSVPITEETRNKISNTMALDQEFDRFIDWTKKHSGSLNPKEIQEGEALAKQLQGAYRIGTDGGVYKPTEQDFIKGIIDSKPTKFFNSIRVLPQLQAAQGEIKAQLDQAVKSRGFRGYGNVANKSGAPEVKYSGGVQYQKVNGGWKKVQKAASK